jgi:mono/diheme cytochrome c family protein
MTASAKLFGAGAAALAAAMLLGIGVPGGPSSRAAFAAPPSPMRAEPARDIQVAQAASKPATAVPAPTTVSAAGITLRSVNVDFPESDRTFPGGAAADPVNTNCTACHSPGMVLTQPKLSPAVWQEEVNKMRHTYKAAIDEADVPAIVAYLAALKPAN